MSEPHQPREGLVALSRRLFGGEHGVDLDLPTHGAAPPKAPPDFSGPEYDSRPRR